MINTSIQRLMNKKLLFRENGKRGRGGFYCFRINEEVKEAAIEYRRLATLDSSEATKVNDQQIEDYEITRIDGRKYSNTILPKEWDEIDIEPLRQIGFSRNHLIQLYREGGFEIHLLQDSIYHFAFDLKYNNKAASITKSSPLGYFIGILKRSAVYAAPDNYEAPKDRALREYLERKKIEKEKRDARLKELINIAFDDWQSKLNQEQKDRLLPEDVRNGRLAGAKLAALRTYFIENVWPQVAPEELGVSTKS
jgi:hypothetical protein